MIRSFKIVVLFLVLLVPTVLSAQSPVELSIAQYRSDPNAAIDTGGIAVPVDYFTFTGTALTTVTCTDSLVAMSGQQQHVSVSFKISKFIYSDHQLDFEKSMVNGKPAMGHDGFHSEEYMSINFSGKKYIEEINVVINGGRHTVPQESFTYFLSPHVYNKSFNSCNTDVIWIEKKGMLVIRLSGGDGAGAYSSYIFFNENGFCGQYDNFCWYPDTYCAGALDHFARKRKEKYYYTFMLNN